MESFKNILKKYEFMCGMKKFETMSIDEAQKLHIMYIESLKAHLSAMNERFKQVREHSVEDLDIMFEASENEVELINLVKSLINNAIEAFVLNCEVLIDVYDRNIDGFGDMIKEAENNTDFDFMKYISELSNIVRSMEV